MSKDNISTHLMFNDFNFQFSRRPLYKIRKIGFVTKINKFSLTILLVLTWKNLYYIILMKYDSYRFLKSVHYIFTAFLDQRKIKNRLKLSR